ncbi:p53 and DNA damage-regulated protein 1 isoform X2 [Electrophorus electricus]|uniref:p53 and DNA damage-regulated protein 1 isoform X2 n=1 Tax=Electrophorus electricus TaxID=8005 RepID=UPI0015CF8F15|nr:p53 and DNA damage-regulated protein 1 isoform X2 [Electrophorus electricus]
MECQRALEHLSEVEAAAEDVLADKQQIVDLDARRNRNREALSALRTGDVTSHTGTTAVAFCTGDVTSHTDKVKVCFGNMFIKFSSERTKVMIQKDQEQLDREINDLRKRLKAKVNRLNDLQGKPELQGYNLSPLSNEELNAIHSILKR